VIRTVVLKKVRDHREAGVSWSAMAVALGVTDATLHRWRRASMDYHSSDRHPDRLANPFVRRSPGPRRLGRPSTGRQPVRSGGGSHPGQPVWWIRRHPGARVRRAVRAGSCARHAPPLGAARRGARWLRGPVPLPGRFTPVGRIWRIRRNDQTVVPATTGRAEPLRLVPAARTRCRVRSPSSSAR